MELNATYEIRGDYLYVKVAGEFNANRARVIFYEWLKQVLSQNLNRVLCDITMVTGLDAETPSMMTRFETSKFVARLLPRGGFMLAVLETPQQLTRGKFDENVMVNRGAVVKVTTDLQSALEWLGVRSTRQADGDGQGGPRHP